MNILSSYPKAIPTRYAGVDFRSRLEADWANSLTQADITWWYEPNTYGLSDGRWYQPDFYLPDSRAWLEVKGIGVGGTDLVETFAADCWAAFHSHLSVNAAADPWESIKADPMVLISREPCQVSELGDLAIQVRGVFGPESRYRVEFLRCLQCEQVGPVEFSATTVCRACGWHGSIWDGFDYEFALFHRLPRPAGRRRSH